MEKTFDPLAVVEEGIDQMESASELCAAAVMDCVAHVLGMQYHKRPEMVSQNQRL